MRILLNGEESETGRNTVAGLLEELDITLGRVAVEVNLKVVKKDEYGNTPLKDGDSVEIVNFVGGG
jgi:sulfur carrier protein